jgi:hypothetical protein
MRTPTIQNYLKNPSRPRTFDLVQEQDKLNIKYFVLSIPRNERFKAQGAVMMIETWTKEGKSFFSGLLRLGATENVLFGNRLDAQGKKSLFCLVQDGDLMQMHHFDNFCPRSKVRQRQYLINYFRDQLITAR